MLIVVRIGTLAAILVNHGLIAVPSGLYIAAEGHLAGHPGLADRLILPACHLVFKALRRASISARLFVRVVV